MIIRHVSYICEPRNINIEVDFPVNSRHITIILKVDNKLAQKHYYHISGYPTKKEEYDSYVKRFCISFINFTEDELYQYSENFMPALNAHRNLKKVLHRAGKVIWRRP